MCSFVYQEYKIHALTLACTHIIIYSSSSTGSYGLLCLHCVLTHSHSSSAVRATKPYTNTRTHIRIRTLALTHPHTFETTAFCKFMAILHLRKKKQLSARSTKRNQNAKPLPKLLPGALFARCCCCLLLFRLMLLLLLLLSAPQLRHRFVVVFVSLCAKSFRFIFFLATFLGLCVLVKVIMSSSVLFTVSQFAIVVAVAAVNC